MNALSTEWLERARARVNADPKFRKRGSIDTQMAISIGGDRYLVSFAAFGCASVRAIGANDLRDADFVVEMSADQWQRFLDGRRDGAGRTLAELDTTDGVVKAQNPRKKLDFLRYHTSIQAFIDAGIQVG